METVPGLTCAWVVHRALRQVTDKTRVVAEEQFGPALPILPFKTDEEAIGRANASE